VTGFQSGGWGGLGTLEKTVKGGAKKIVKERKGRAPKRDWGGLSSVGKSVENVAKNTSEDRSIALPSGRVIDAETGKARPKLGFGHAPVPAAQTRQRLLSKLASRKPLTKAEQRWIEQNALPGKVTSDPRAAPLGAVTKDPLLRAEVKRTDRKIKDAALEAEIGRAIDPYVAQAMPGTAGQIARGIAGSILPGPGIAKAIKGEDVEAWELALDAALFPLPLKGVPTAAAGALRAARGLGKGKKLGEALREPIRPLRSLRYRGKTQQLPDARSPVTRNVIEKPADAVSRAMMGEGRVARGARKVFPTASAAARVSRHSAREAKQKAIRIAAGMNRFVRKLPEKDSPTDVAHFWWAQMPKALRNAEGLGRVRKKLAANLEEIVSGRAYEQLAARKVEIEAAMKAEFSYDLMEELGKVKILISDLKPRSEDISLAIAQLDGIIAKPPRLNPQIIRAVEALSGDRRIVMEAAGALDPEKATAREGLVSRWLGEEATGEEIYVGHRLGGKVRGANQSLMPISVGTGRQRLPEGIATANKLVRANTGRVRASTHVAAEDWQAAQTYRQGLDARDTFWQAGVPFEMKLSKGERIVNRRGLIVPRHWKTNRLEELAEQGYPEEALEDAAREIVQGFMATADDDWRAITKGWVENGANLEDLRVVDESFAKRYYAQFLPPARGTLGGKVYDAAIDFTMMSIVFARIGYIPKNTLANFIITIPHQGAFFAFNAPRAAQVLKNPRLRDLVRAETGDGATAVLASEARNTAKLRGAPHKAAEVVTSVADMPWRTTAYIHELAKEGVIPRFKWHLSPEDEEAIIRFITSDNPKRNSVMNRTRGSMVDFTRMTPTQMRWWRRFIIIPGWLWSGSRYPFWFAANYPGRSAAMAYVAAGEPGAPEELQFNKPIDEYLVKGVPSFARGIPLLGGVLRSNSIDPVSTPWQLAGAAIGKDEQRLGDYTTPLPVAIFNTALSRVNSPSGAYRTDFPTALRKNFERVAPNVKLAEDLISPPDDPFYPGDKTRLGRLAREAGVVPIEVPREATPQSRARAEYAKDRAELRAKLDKAGVHPSVIRATKKAWGLREKLYVALDEIDNDLKGVDYQREALRVEYQLAQNLGLRPRGGDRAQAFFAASPAVRKRIIESWSGENIERLRRELSYYAFGGATIAAARRELED
jgi:hypothetical protein